MGLTFKRSPRAEPSHTTNFMPDIINDSSTRLVCPSAKRELRKESIATGCGPCRLLLSLSSYTLTIDIVFTMTNGRNNPDSYAQPCLLSSATSWRLIISGQRLESTSVPATSVTLPANNLIS